MDWIGSWSLSLAVTALMLGLSVGPSVGWTSPATVATFVASGVLVGVFVLRVRHARFPFIPAHYFARRNFVMPMVLRACANFAYFGAFFLFPLLMEQGYGYSIPRVGAIAIARPITFALCSPIAGYVAMRIGERVSAVAGASFLTGSMALFALLHLERAPGWSIVALALSGLGMGVAMPSTSSVMANEVTRQRVRRDVGRPAARDAGGRGRRDPGPRDRAAGARAPPRTSGRRAPGAALLATFHLPFEIGAVVAAAGLCRVVLPALGAASRTREAERATPVVWAPMAYDVAPGCEPFSPPAGPFGVLVLHGFTGNPTSMRPLAQRFADAGLRGRAATAARARHRGRGHR